MYFIIRSNENINNYPKLFTFYHNLILIKLLYYSYIILEFNNYSKYNLYLWYVARFGNYLIFRIFFPKRKCFKYFELGIYRSY